MERIEGHTLHGTWYDRSTEYEARRQGKEFSPGEFATRYEVPLSPLPCWENLPIEEQRKKARRMVEDIERETRERLENEISTVLGINLVRQTHPHYRPRKIKRSPAPSCHCSESFTWKEFRDGYRWFVSVYRAAARRLKRGDQADGHRPGGWPAG